MIEKCLRDIPRMPKNMLPTAVEKSIINGKERELNNLLPCVPDSDTNYGCPRT